MPCFQEDDAVNPYERRPLRNAWTLGERAGRRDEDLRECPYSANTMAWRIAWFYGHAAGLRDV